MRWQDDYRKGDLVDVYVGGGQWKRAVVAGHTKKRHAVYVRFLPPLVMPKQYTVDFKKGIRKSVLHVVGTDPKCETCGSTGPRSDAFKSCPDCYEPEGSVKKG